MVVTATTVFLYCIIVSTLFFHDVTIFAHGFSTPTAFAVDHESSTSSIILHSIHRNNGDKNAKSIRRRSVELLAKNNKEESLDDSANAKESKKSTGKDNTNKNNEPMNEDRDSQRKEQQAGGVTKIVGRVAGRLFNNNSSSSNSRDKRKKKDDDDSESNKEEKKESDGLFRKAFRGARLGNNEGNDDVTKNSMGDDDTNNNKNMLDRFLESRRQKPNDEVVVTKDPFEKLLASIDQAGKEMDVTRLGQTIVKIEESLVLVKEKLANYQRRTLTLEEAKKADKEIKRLTGLRKEIELRRKKLILEKSKLDREIIQKKAKLNDDNKSQPKKENKQTAEEASSLDKNTAVNKDRKKKEKRLDTVSISTKKNNDNNNSTSLITNTQNLISNVLESMISKREAKRAGWVFLCPKTRISPGEIVPVVASGLDLLIIGSRDGEKVYCVANSCPHLGTPLETGIVQRRPREVNRGMNSNNNEDDNNPTSKRGKTGNALVATDEKKVSSTDGSSKNKEKKKKKSDKMFGSSTDMKKSKNKETPTISKQQWPSPSSKDDGCEECIVCPLHQTAFALESGEVRGEWCPFPPMLGKMMGNVRRESTLPTFLMRIRGKNIEVRLNSSLEE